MKCLKPVPTPIRSLPSSVPRLRLKLLHPVLVKEVTQLSLRKTELSPAPFCFCCHSIVLLRVSFLLGVLTASPTDLSTCLYIGIWGVNRVISSLPSFLLLLGIQPRQQRKSLQTLVLGRTLSRGN